MGTVPAMTKAFDPSNLGGRLQALALPNIEGLAKSVVDNVLFSWIGQSMGLLAVSQPIYAIGVPLLAALKAPVDAEMAVLMPAAASVPAPASAASIPAMTKAFDPTVLVAYLKSLALPEAEAIAKQVVDVVLGWVGDSMALLAVSQPIYAIGVPLLAALQAPIDAELAVLLPLAASAAPAPAGS